MSSLEVEEVKEKIRIYHRGRRGSTEGTERRGAERRVERRDAEDAEEGAETPANQRFSHFQLCVLLCALCVSAFSFHSSM